MSEENGVGEMSDTKEQSIQEVTFQKSNTEEQARQIASELGLPSSKIRATVELLDDGNTVPFIARYRKETTGELDENDIRHIEERLQYVRNLEERKEEVVRLIDEQGKMTPSLLQSITQASKLQVVEDLYRPYRQKRATRASIAREKGLEGLATWLLTDSSSDPIDEEVAKYVSEEHEVSTLEDARQGAQDIIAEQVADDANIRAWVRSFTFNQGIIVTEARDSEAESVYEMYYDYREPVKRLPPHRILAINRGEREKVLRVKLDVPDEQILSKMKRQFSSSRSDIRELLNVTIEDAYKRLIAPSIEREIRNHLTEQAEAHAITIFAENLRNLLLQPPVKGTTVLGVDPAYRTGCKLSVVDDTGKLLDVAVIYPTPPVAKVQEAEAKVIEWVDRYDIRLIAIGNGTASRETEQFIADTIRLMPNRELKYVIVNEAGASVYSASKLAQEEFPALDVAERSAVSIARRLQDPLAELVKIDPQAIGIGQYQHDVSQRKLGESLKVVVESAVNHVGVDVNTASTVLLSYVAGISKTVAQNIIDMREAEGKFTKRSELKKVPRLGAKTYEQCIGFLRISDGLDPLDNTPIHPESYHLVDRLFKEMELDTSRLGTNELKETLEHISVPELAAQLRSGVPTLTDIIDSLLRPGRDPRDQMPPPIFHTDVLKLEDLTPSMELKGTVRNVTDFGAFVDIGVENDGLVHISKLSEQYVKHPMDVVAVGDTVTVWVLSVEEKNGRISLTMVPST